MFCCCTLLYVHSSFVMVVWLFLAVPWGCLRFVIVVFADYTHLLCLVIIAKYTSTLDATINSNDF